MSNSPLFYIYEDALAWQKYIGTRDVITWSAARFPSDYASVELKPDDDACYFCNYGETHKAISVGDVELNYIRKVFRS